MSYFTVTGIKNDFIDDIKNMINDYSYNRFNWAEKSTVAGNTAEKYSSDYNSGNKYSAQVGSLSMVQRRTDEMVYNLWGRNASSKNTFVTTGPAYSKPTSTVQQNSFDFLSSFFTQKGINFVAAGSASAVSEIKNHEDVTQNTINLQTIIEQRMEIAARVSELEALGDCDTDEYNQLLQADNELEKQQTELEKL